MSWLSMLQEAASFIPKQKWEELVLLTAICILALLLIVPTIKKDED